MVGGANPTLEILLPTPPVVGAAESETFALGRPVEDATVGLRLDFSWRAYMVVVDEWGRLLRRDGARVEVLWTGDRVGPVGERTRSDLDDWSRLVDCGVVGLGN
ncbi:MAG: hypothetical protein QOF40_1140 [Actinomycetota bacterium]|jgi:hypothetical protein|nr:hypothetical protein [Actinomycetota bacterium]